MDELYHEKEPGQGEVVRDITLDEVEETLKKHGKRVISDKKPGIEFGLFMNVNASPEAISKLLKADIQPGDYRLIFAIMSFLSTSGTCHVTGSVLAEVYGLNTKVAQRAVKRLQAADLIRWFKGGKVGKLYLPAGWIFDPEIFSYGLNFIYQAAWVLAEEQKSTAEKIDDNRIKRKQERAGLEARLEEIKAEEYEEEVWLESSRE